MSIVRKIQRTKILVLDQLKTYQCLYQIMLFVVRKKSRFSKNQEASKLLSKLGTRTQKQLF